MTTPDAGGYEWQTGEHVDRYTARLQALTAERRAGFAGILGELPADTEIPLRIIDLGAGDGAVAELVLDTYPRARAVLVDFSAVMMDKGIKRMRRFGDRYRYLTWDMNVGAWPVDLTGPFDAVVSSAAVHHLQNDRKEWLAAAVFARLTEGGVYANYDLFRNPDAAYPAGEVHDRTLATIDEARQFLTEARYGDVSVTARSARPSHQGEVALIVGRKPAKTTAAK
jgi:tRNA (cmo5U34)-methyltransferase